jgi:hypothetical protein
MRGGNRNVNVSADWRAACRITPHNDPENRIVSTIWLIMLHWRPIFMLLGNETWRSNVSSHPL